MVTAANQTLLIHAKVEGVETPREGWAFSASETIQIGRSNSNDLILNHPQVSRSHASVFHDGECWQFSSFGTNASFLKDVEISNVVIEDGMQIFLGRSGVTLSFLFTDNDDSLENKGSVTFHLNAMKAGDESSVKEIWARCFSIIAKVAQQQMQGANKRVADEEDIAASVFESLFFGAVGGKFPGVNDRDSLWRLIVVMTRRKAADYIAHENRLKRGGGLVRGDSIGPGDPSTDSGPSVFDNFVSEQPTPENIAIVEEQTAHLLSLLQDDEHREVALLRLQGMTNAEIATQLSSSVRTVERRVKQIRVAWEHATTTDY
jgi:pSer/pThr/pTyr-binding forkhead associated (FHA) protein